MRRWYLTLAAAFLAAPAPAQTADPTYWKDIRPLFRKHCTACHSARTVKEVEVSGGLALDSYEAIKKGSARAVVQPGKGGDSLLYQLLVTKDKKARMPLDAAPLSEEQAALVKRWIDAGAREGVRVEEPAAPVAKKSGPRRLLDVRLATDLIPPPAALGKAKPARLDLILKVGPLAPVTAVAFSPDGKLLAVGRYGQVTVWGLNAVLPVKVLTNVLGAVNDVRFSPDGKLLAVSGGAPSGKGDLRIYQTADWKLLHVLRGHDDVVFSVAWRPDGKELASASFDRTVKVWDPHRGAALRTFDGHSDFVYAVAYSPDGKVLASASKDRTVKLVEAATGKSVFTFGGLDDDVMAVAFSPDGKRVASSGLQPGLYWWDATTGERIKVQAGHGIAVHEIAFSKDGKLAVSAGADRTVRTWDAATGTPGKVMQAGSPVYSVAVSPDGKRLASGSFDGLVRLWDAAGGRLLLTLLSLEAEEGSAGWLALTPEGYAAGSDSVVSLGRWRAAGQELAGAALWEALRQPAQVARAAAGQVLPPAFKQ